MYILTHTNGSVHVGKTLTVQVLQSNYIHFYCLTYRNSPSHKYRGICTYFANTTENWDYTSAYHKEQKGLPVN